MHRARSHSCDASAQLLGEQVLRRSLYFRHAYEKKVKLLERSGIDHLVIVPFSFEFSQLSADEYIQRFLVEKFEPKHIVIGYDHRFGLNRQGDINFLRWHERALGYKVVEIEEAEIDEAAVSSTRIRRLLQSGDVRQAEQCLGRAYALSGSVIQGAQRGQTLGWPTANLRLPAGRVIPADGVYATRTVAGGEIFESVSYIGMRPTFGAGERLLEVYLLDQQRDLYGQDLRVEFVDRLRGDETFRSADELAERIGFDVRRAREILRLGPAPLPT